MRACIGGLLALGLLLQSSASIASGAGSTSLQSVEATFLAVDLQAKRVSYLTEIGSQQSLPVSSAEALTSLAKSKPGRKVILKCRYEGTGSLVVEEVKGKANWLKRSLIIVAVVVTMGAVLVSGPAQLQ